MRIAAAISASAARHLPGRRARASVQSPRAPKHNVAPHDNNIINTQHVYTRVRYIFNRLPDY